MALKLEWRLNYSKYGICQGTHECASLKSYRFTLPVKPAAVTIDHKFKLKLNMWLCYPLSAIPIKINMQLSMIAILNVHSDSDNLSLYLQSFFVLFFCHCINSGQ